MDINQLLAGVHCTCGKVHTCNIEAVYVERGAAARLKELCKADDHILLVADENTLLAAGASVLAALDGKRLTSVIFSGKEILVPNEAAIDRVTEKLTGIDMIVGIGSGVIQDLCKYVSHYNQVPYIIVATAPSMDGYASNGAAMITDGMKVTYPAGLPKAILADTQVLTEAPMEMLKAGYGDIIGKFSALNDWKLSHCINGEYFCRYIYDLTYEQIKRTLSLAEGVLQRKEESVKTLMEGLVIIGILMSFAGSSRPASGSEHHLSHFFEITGILDHTEYFPHGIDVAYSTVVTAALREKILANPFPTSLYRPQKEQYEAKMKEIYKESAAGCIALQEKVGNYAKDRTSIYLQKEEEIRRILAEMPTAREIERMLALVELDMKDFYALYGEEKVENAILYAKELKDRYTVLWINYDFFGKDN
ncbi:MAG: sn-glycerol-1-phosphate dehydrogenase [Clostridia bacterium]|nr:sn-glycerol-1-phosphate dehydrogenase [Clostridia bacterium]